MKTIEIKGIGFPNKGAELLLEACLSRIWQNSNRICIEPFGPYQHRAKFPLWTKLRASYHGINLLSPLSLAPTYVSERMGWVKPSSVDIVLDASGYAYGDPWPLSLAKNRVLTELERVQTTFLPQSFGPFSRPHSQQVIKKIVKHGHRVYCRESIGADYIEQITKVRPKVVPDITIALQPTFLTEVQHDVLVIPNFQVLDRLGGAYLEQLTLIACQLVALSRDVTLLNHEGARDQAICEMLVNNMVDKIGYKPKIAAPKSGAEAKAIISKANLVLSSRYHGLVSAISCKVPCYAIGWSYKYDELFARFQIPAPPAMASPIEVAETITSNQYTSHFCSDAYQTQLDRALLEIEEMWNEILEPIR